MKAKIVWVEMFRWCEDGYLEPVSSPTRDIRFEEPASYDSSLYEKFVLIPVEDEE